MGEVKGWRKVWEAAKIGGRGSGRSAGERWEGHSEEMVEGRVGVDVGAGGSLLV